MCVCFVGMCVFVGMCDVCVWMGLNSSVLFISFCSIMLKVLKLFVLGSTLNNFQRISRENRGVDPGVDPAYPLC